jgi:hypothetical protein
VGGRVFVADYGWVGEYLQSRMLLLQTCMCAFVYGYGCLRYVCVFTKEMGRCVCG